MTTAALSAALAAVVSAGCESPTAGTASASPSAATATTTPAPPAAAPPATTTASPRGRQSTSGEEQMKYLCEQGQSPKADCDAFFEQARRDGVRFNP